MIPCPPWLFACVFCFCRNPDLGSQWEVVPRGLWHSITILHTNSSPNQWVHPEVESVYLIMSIYLQMLIAPYTFIIEILRACSWRVAQGHETHRASWCRVFVQLQIWLSSYPFTCIWSGSMKPQVLQTVPWILYQHYYPIVYGEPWNFTKMILCLLYCLSILLLPLAIILWDIMRYFVSIICIVIIIYINILSFVMFHSTNKVLLSTEYLFPAIWFI